MTLNKETNMKSNEINVIKSIYKTSVSHYDGHINSMTSGTTNSDLIVNNLCDNTDETLDCSSRMNGILEEFTKLYAEKLLRIGDVSGEEDLKKKISVLECWVNDLGEQNSILVSTVEDLEKEASRRVSLLQEKLDKMAVVTRESCVSLRDHQVQVTSLIKQKLSAEDESKLLQEKILTLGESNNTLLQENTNLRQDIDNLLEVISRGRHTGKWDCSDYNFKLIRSDQITRTIIPHLTENSENNHSRKDSLTSNMSVEGEEMLTKLKQELHNLKKIHRETNIILTQRDKHIADLQAQLTELHHKFSASQAQVDNTTSTLHSLLDRGRQDSFEIFRRDDVIRQLLSPSRRFKNDNLLMGEDESKVKLDAEYQLSNNIDILANRLSDLEDECQHLRHQNIALKNTSTQNLKLNEGQSNSSSNIDIRSKNAISASLNVISQQTQTHEVGTSTSDLLERNVEKIPSADLLRLSKLENELSEKNILVRELQNHLVLSREELRLKDETLYNVEQKLDCCRRNYDEKEERMLYLTSQLTNLQLEVSRLHGNLQQLRLQLDNKSQLVLKLEYENRSLVRQLNEKSSVYEGIQRDFSHLISDIEKKKKEISDQKLTIGTLQDALVAAKLNCDRLRSQFGPESVSNLALNILRPTVLHSGRMDNIPSKEPASQMSKTLPDIRSLNTDSPPLHRNCPDVVSFPCRETEKTADNYFQSKLQTETSLLNSYPSLRTLNINEKMSQTELQSLQLNSVETPTFSPSDSFHSLNNFTSDYKPLLAQSPTDSGIGSEDFGNEKESFSETHTKKNANLGKIYEI